MSHKVREICDDCLHNDAENGFCNDTTISEETASKGGEVLFPSIERDEYMYEEDETDDSYYTTSSCGLDQPKEQQQPRIMRSAESLEHTRYPYCKVGFKTTPGYRLVTEQTYQGRIIGAEPITPLTKDNKDFELLSKQSNTSNDDIETDTISTQEDDSDGEMPIKKEN